MSINKLLEVEEHVWSPKFGLKGNIDATVQVTISEPGQERTLTVPLELKTGRNTSSVSHQAQTALYTLLLSDRYGAFDRYPMIHKLNCCRYRRNIRYSVLSRGLFHFKDCWYS